MPGLESHDGRGCQRTTRPAATTLALTIGFGLASLVSVAARSMATPADEAATGAAQGPCPTDFTRSIPIPAAREVVIPARKKAWERSVGGEAAARPYIQARLAGWPRHVLADRAGLPAADRDFLLRVAHDTWNGLSALADRDNGLPIDNVRFTKQSVEIADAHIGDYTSGTNIGLNLITIVAAHELQFISEAQALAQIRRVLDTLQHVETYRGFVFNFYDTTSLERTSNFVSFIDAAWLTAGLMVARTTFPALAAPCSRLIESMDYRFFYNAETRRISQGYYVNAGISSPYDYGMLYTEARLGSLIAIGKGDIPETQWFQMIRTFAARCGGQTQTPRASRLKRVRGHEVSAGYYEWGGLRYVPSWGGSMFEALMPTLVLDEAQFAPKSLGANDRVHAAVQRRYCLETLGCSVWGMSPSATPAGQRYGEYGVGVLGARGYEAGPVAPHASALALSVTPDDTIANLRRLVQRYDIYGEYGFYDAVNPQSGAVAYTYLSLDQSMLFIALANYLEPHSVQKRFASDAIMQAVLPLIGDEDFFD